jgi:hypothetical protein
MDGGGDELRGLGIDGAADDPARVPGGVLRVGGHVSAPLR